MDVIFYFTVSLLIATILCYLIFLVKNNIQKNDIIKITEALQTVGTDAQKAQEKEVINYQRKINDFAQLLKNHTFSSHAFAFMQKETMPNIWFNQFGFNSKDSQVQLSGEADSLDALSRQVAGFEKNEYVKNLGSLTASLGESARMQFSFALTLDSNIFDFSSDLSLTSTVSPSDQQVVQPPVGEEKTLPAGANQKMMTSFHLLLEPEVVAVIDQITHSVKADVPYGTDIKKITTSIVLSPGATVFPAPDTPQDFTSPVKYTITAQDGSTQDYRVLVSVLPQKGAKTSTKSNTGLGVIIAILVIIVIIVVGVIIFFAWKKMQSNKNAN
jgi:hypothetical protein